MAIDNQFGKGIGVAAGFDLGAQKPLDARIAVNTIAERDAHVENNRAYEGMIVFVDETKKNYQLVNGEWVELLKAEQDRLDALEAMLNGKGEGEEGQAGGALGALQDSIDDVNDRLEEGGDIENRISQNESDIVALQELVGQPVQAGEGEEEDVPATGLHLALDNAKAELEQAILTEKGRAEGQEAAIRDELADEAAEIREEMAAELGNYTVEAAEGVEGKVASGLRKEIEDAHKAMDQAAANEAARVNQKIADDIAAESALRVAEEQRIEKAAQDAMVQEVKDRDAAIKVEADRAELAEAGLATRVKALEDDKPLKEQAIQAVVDDLAAEVERATKKEGELDKALEDAIAKEVEDRNAAIKVEADRAKGVEAEQLQAIEQLQSDIDELKGDAGIQGVNAAITSAKEELQNAIKAEAERADAEEKRIVGLVNAEAAKAREEEGKLDAAIKAEVARADAEEKRIVGLVEAEAGRADAEEKRIVGLVEAEAELARAEEGKLDARIKAFEEGDNSVAKQIEALADRHDDEMDAVEARVLANENKLAGLEKDTVQAAIDQAEADAKAHAEQKITELVDSAPDAMNTLNELAKAINDNKGVYDAWVVEHNQAMADMKKDLQDEIDADVKVVADELAKQKDAAQEGTLAKQIADEAARAAAQETAIRGEFASAMAGEISDRNAAIDVEKQRAMAEEADIRQEMATEAARVNKKIADDIAAESTLRVAEEARIEREYKAAIAKEVEDRDAAIAVETQRADAEEKAIRQLVANEKAALQKEIDDEVKVVADELANEKKADVEGTLANLIKVEKERAEGVESTQADQIEALQVAVGELSGDEGLVKGLEERIATIEDDYLKAEDKEELSNAILTEKGRAEGQEAAIRKEFADADSALRTGVTALVNSLELVLEDTNKIKLTVGTENAVATLSSIELEVVTEADIDEILGGLE